jgi:hypothetical protein
MGFSSDSIQASGNSAATAAVKSIGSANGSDAGHRAIILNAIKQFQDSGTTVNLQVTRFSATAFQSGKQGGGE